MKKIFPFLKPYTLQLIVGPVFKLSEAVLEIITPILMAMLIDNGINGANHDYILRMSGLMFLSATGGVLFAFICQYSASIASQGFGTDLRNAVFKKITSFSFTDLDRFGASSLVNRVTGDINQLQTAVAMLIRLVIRAPFLCVGGLIMAMSIDLKLSVIFMIVIPLFILVLFLVMFKAVPLYKSVQNKLDALTLVLRENLSGVRVIRAFSGVKREEKRFEDANFDYEATAVRVGRIAALTNPATTIIMNLAIIAVLYFGGVRINTGSLTQGQVIAFINYITQILNAMIVVANLVILYTKAYASAIRVGEVLNTEPSITDGASDKKIGAAPDIEFCNVDMVYGKSREASLKNISLKIEGGTTVGIIGSTGSGKSSLVNLIPRFYDAAKGEVKIDGENVKNYKLSALSDGIAMVQQRANLFSGTIAANLLMANPDATPEELDRALDTAQASEFVNRLNNGITTHVSQDGHNLSGGQKQRITIARALVKNSPILIMDDSASALDYATDAALRRSIREIGGDKTVIIVSQRVNSVMDADKIVVLDEAEMVGCGTHEELILSCPIYREFCVSQEIIEGGEVNENE